MGNVLDGLAPKEVFRYFEEICSIPHGSGNVKKISDYLAGQAVKNGLKYVQEPCGNVIIYKDATPGYENEPGIILQGHMDMVAVKDAGCPIDMEREGLSVFTEGDRIGARGTSLGGDDGIAIAYGLAILADPGIKHPALTFVATVNEETGMDGAIELDPAFVTARRLINLDSEDEGIFVAGCAGGATLRLRTKLTRDAVSSDKAYTVTLGGLSGGHSGTEIHKNKGNALLLLTRVLNALSGQGFRVVSVNGGTKDNAIPNTAEAVITGSGEPDVSGIEAELKNAYTGKEDGLFVSAEACDGAFAPLSPDCEKRLLTLLSILPFGPSAMSTLPGLTETSNNVGILKTGAEEAEIAVSVRSLIESEKENLIDKISRMAELCGFTVSRNSEYPGWQYRTDSPLREKAVRIFRKMYGRDPEVMTIHAGLECGLFSKKLPGLDAISLGPQMHDIHTTKERLEIGSTKRTWELLLGILAEKD